MKEEPKNEAIEVSRETIATLAAQAIADLEGASACQPKAVDTIASRVKGEYVHKGIKVDKGSGGDYRLSVCLRVKYGKNIPELALEAREKVKEYVEGLTDIVVEDVEIVVEDIEIPAT